MENNFASVLNLTHGEAIRLQFDLAYRKHIYSIMMKRLFEQIINNTNDGQDIEKAYRFSVQLKNKTILIAQLQEIKTETSYVVVPKVTYADTHYSIKDRLKILFRGKV